MAKRSPFNEPSLMADDSMVFDILETLASAVEEGGNLSEAEQLRSCFSRYTDGIDLECVLDTIREWDITL